MAIIHSLICIVPFSLVLPLAITRCHLLSFVVTHCHSMLLADIRCTTHCPFCHLLLFVVTLCTTCCHSLLLVVTRCITSLSFYEISIQSIKFATMQSLKIDVHKFQKCKEKTYSLSKTFQAVHSLWNCLAKMQAQNFQIY